MAAFRGYQPISQPLDQYSVRRAAGLAHGLQPTAAAAIFSAGSAKRRPLARRVTLERTVESRILIDRTRLSRARRAHDGYGRQQGGAPHIAMIGRRPEYGLLGDRLAIQAFGWRALLTISDCPAIAIARSCGSRMGPMKCIAIRSAAQIAKSTPELDDCRSPGAAPVKIEEVQRISLAFISYSLKYAKGQPAVEAGKCVLVGLG